jgi:hypothetical protein
MLVGLGEQEVLDIVKEQGAVNINCEFCDAEYAYDAVDVAALFRVCRAMWILPRCRTSGFAMVGNGVKELELSPLQFFIVDEVLTQSLRRLHSTQID